MNCPNNFTTTMKLTTLFQRPSAEAIAKAELEDARRELLAAESSAEYARQIAAYNKARIERLTAFLNNTTTTTKS